MNNLEARLAEIRERIEKASPGPWKAEWDFCDWNFPYSQSVYRGEEEPIKIFSSGSVMCIGKESPKKEASKRLCAADAALTAHSRTDIPLLLEVIEVQAKALGFYADKDHWDFDSMTPSCWDDGSIDLGKRSREAMERVEELCGGGNEAR